jgi:integrase
MSSPEGNRRKYLLKDAKSPYWQYDFSIAGERERGTTRERSAAKAAEFVEARRTLMRQRQAAARMGVTAPTTKPITLFEACAVYEGKFKKVDPTTRYQIENLCALLCADGRDRKLSDITTRDFADYRLRRQRKTGAHGKPLAQSSINREVQLARRVWLYAAHLDYEVGRMPKWSKVIHAHEEQPSERFLTPAEETRLFAALDQINPDLRAMAEFALLSGQRKTAVVKLRWADVDLDEQQAKFVLKGRGEKKRVHVLPLTARMVQIISGRPRVGPYVFTYECRRDGPRRADRVVRIKGLRFPFSPQGWTRQWRAALRKAGIDNFRWHDLRHSAATRLLSTTNNLKIVQEVLGHQSIQQTARYAHLSLDDLRRAMEQVGSGPQVTRRAAG